MLVDTIVFETLSMESFILVTPTLSEADADTDTVPETVEPSAGLLMFTVGGMLSTVTEIADETPLFSAASYAFAKRL